MSQKALVALVGRPNVGKSTLFNRIVGQRLAVVSEIPGTTRDRLYAEADWAGVSFILVDTGGLEITEGRNTEPLSQDSEQFLPLIRQQATIAIQDADVIVQVVDGQAGITAADQEVADILRRSKKPIIVAVNKLESTRLWDGAFEFYELALGEIFPVSALHGTGSGNLLDAIIEGIPPFDDEEEDESIKVAILGRPNVGKSTLLNKLLGEDRAIVSPIAGTTRDATDTRFTWGEQEYTLIDTAGIRRRGKIDPGVEKYSVLRALKALRRADVAAESASAIVLVNKWDIVDKDSHTIYQYTDQLRSALSFMPYVPLLFISAKSGQRINKIMPTVSEVYDARFKRIATSELNRLMRDAVGRHPPPQKGGVRVKFLYATQARVDPPTFVFFVNKPDWVHFSYQRYLENRIREDFPFPGTPIKLFFRSRSENRFSDKM